MNFIIVAHPETGKIFTEAKKPGFFKCQIKDAEEQIVVTNGLISMQQRVAFPALTEKVVNSKMFKDLKDGDIFPLDGKIVRTVTSNPQWEDHSPVMNPNTKEELDYYQSYVFSTDPTMADKDLRGLPPLIVEERVLEMMGS